MLGRQALVRGSFWPLLVPLLALLLALYAGRMAAGGLGRLDLLALGAIGIAPMLPLLMRRLQHVLFLLIFLMAMWSFSTLFTGQGFGLGGNLTLLPFLTALLGVLWLSRLALKDVAFVRARALVYMFALLAVLGASTLTSTDPPFSLVYLISFAAAMALAFLIVQLVRTPEDLGRVGWVIILSTTLLALLLLLIKLGLLPAEIGDVRSLTGQGGSVIQRVGGIAAGISGTAIVLTVGIAFALHYLLSSRSRGKSLFLLLSLLLLFLAQLQTISGVVFVGTGVVVLLTLYSVARNAFGQRASRLRTPLGRLLLAVALLGGLFLLSAPLYESRIAKQIEKTQTQGIEYLGTMRIGVWIGAVRVAARYPWLGTGPGNGQFFIPFYSDFPITNNTGAHNAFLSLAADAGVAAPGLMLVLWLSVLVSVWRALRRGSRMSLEMEVYGKVILITLVALFAIALVHNLERSRWLWLLLGLGMAYAEIVKGWEWRRKLSATASSLPPVAGEREQL